MSAARDCPVYGRHRKVRPLVEIVLDALDADRLGRPAAPSLTHSRIRDSVRGDLPKAGRACGPSAASTTELLTYEAGYEGFWLARDIEHRDAEIDIFMNDPASLRVNRRAKKKKTDRIDARRMVRALKAWDQGDSEAMSWVRVPDVDREDARRLLRERDTLVKERTRLNNRIKGLLQLHGIFDLAPRKPDFLERLASARTGYGAPLPPRARAEIERTVALLRLVEGHIDMIKAEKRALL